MPFPHRIFRTPLIILLMVSLFWGCASKKYFTPVREIDRTINPPVGTRGVTSTGAADFKGDEVNFYITDLIIPMHAIYGISNNLCYPMFPFPALQFALINAHEIRNDSVFIKRFNLSIAGGLTGLAYSQRDGFYQSLFGNVKTKLLISDGAWIDLSGLIIRNNSSYSPVTELIGDCYLSFQLTNHLFSSIGYRPYYYRQISRYIGYTNEDLYHEIRILMGLNVSPFFGVRAYSGVTYHRNLENYSIPVGLSLESRW